MHGPPGTVTSPPLQAEATARPHECPRLTHYFRPGMLAESPASTLIIGAWYFRSLGNTGTGTPSPSTRPTLLRSRQRTNSGGRLQFRTWTGLLGPAADVIRASTNAMLQWNLLLTGIIRGKKLLVLVGQKKPIAIAVRNVSGRRRWSKLAEWLAPASRGR